MALHRRAVRCGVIALGLGGLFSGRGLLAQTATPAAPAGVPITAPGPDDVRRMRELGQSVARLTRAGSFDEAITLSREMVAICERALGPGHWQTGDARRTVETLKLIASLPEEGRRALATSFALEVERDALEKGSRFADAERLARQILENYWRWLGGGHLMTAKAFSRLAVTLYSQGKYTEAERLFRTALAACLTALGDDHPDTARSYDSLARVLAAQRKYAEAEPLYRKGLALRL